MLRAAPGVAVGDLAVAATTTYICTASGVAADFTNIASVTADHPAGGSVSDSDTADVDVIAPAIDIQKTPDLQQILSGDDATFTITVTNTGDVTLSNLDLTDTDFPIPANQVPATLGVGDSFQIVLGKRFG